MSNCKSLFFSLLTLVCFQTLTAQTARRAGINLTGVVDYSTELVFTDAFKQCREWTVHDLEPGGDWDTGVAIPLSADGYPLEIPYDNGIDPLQSVRALMLWDIEGHYPAGKYRLMVSGNGTVRLWGAASGTFECPLDTLVDVNPANGGVVLEIDRSLRSNPVRDIRFIYPEYRQTFQQQEFRKDFLDYVSDFQVIRFMDWLRTNNSEVTAWSDRTPDNYYTQSKNSGVAWEIIVRLCNLTEKDAWINIPHQADDNYIRQLATLLRDQLDPKLKVYLEYSNEVWNGIFEQSYFAGEAGAALGYTGQPWEQSWKYTAKRSADIFHIFETVFQGSDRLKKVLPAQAANSWITGQIIGHFNDPQYNPSGVKADGIAIAPYFGGHVPDEIGENNEVGSVSVATILQRAEGTFPETFQWMDEHLALAKQYGLELMAYEGGQHLVATYPHVENDALTAKLIAVNRDPEMGQLYCEYLDYWYEKAGGGLFCLFSSHGLPSRWGSWGMKEHMQDTLSPKYLAVQNCVLNKTATSIRNEEANGQLLVFPNPSTDGVFWVHHTMQQPEVVVYDVLGRRIRATVSQPDFGQTRIVLPDGSGIFLAVLSDGKLVHTVKLSRR